MNDGNTTPAVVGFGQSPLKPPAVRSMAPEDDENERSPLQVGRRFFPPEQRNRFRVGPPANGIDIIV